jgi:hypothetical protein
MFVAAIEYTDHLAATPVAPSCFQNWIHVGGMETNTGNKAPRPADGAARKTRGGRREVVSAFLRLRFLERRGNDRRQRLHPVRADR